MFLVEPITKMIRTREFFFKTLCGTITIVTCMVIFVCALYIRHHCLNETREETRVETWKDIFDDPLRAERVDCRHLFSKPTTDEEFYTSSFLEHRRRFNATWNTAKKRQRYMEGHSSEVSSQSRLYYWLSRRPWVKTICEIGFNAGHSTLQWLAASEDVIVYSFDLGEHAYTRPMAAYFSQTFPDRFHLNIGDSLQTVPLFTRNHSDVKCDVLVVDGGHSYEIALGDLINMRALANRNHHVLIFDDYPGLSNFLPGLGHAWNRLRAEGYVVDKYACAEGPIRKRGFVVGYYIINLTLT